VKVYELIKKLQELPQDLEVLTSSDDEGNNFRKVSEGWVNVEKFDISLDIIDQEDYKEYNDDDLEEYVVIG